MTPYLASAYTIAPVPSLRAKEISKGILETGDQQPRDPGFGSSGPTPVVVAELARLGHPVILTPTDIHPRPFDEAGTFRYWPRTVDARDVPGELGGSRTIFAAFHHFDESGAVRILADASARRAPICVFEAKSRTVPAIHSAAEMLAMARAAPQPD